MIRESLAVANSNDSRGDMAGVRKHPNEYNLTRWYMAHILDRASADDLVWLTTELGSFGTNLWRYKAGKRAMKWRNFGGEIKQLDERFPGSAAILNGPVGRILMGAKLTKPEIFSAIMELDDPYRTILLGGGYGPDSESRPSRPMDEVFDELELFPYQRTIEAIVCMLSWADHDQNHDTWNAVCRFYRYMIPQFVMQGAVKHHEIIFDAMDELALFRNFSANDRREHRLNWRREIPRIRKLRKHRAREIMVGWEKSNRMANGDPPALAQERRLRHATEVARRRETSMISKLLPKLTLKKLSAWLLG